MTDEKKQEKQDYQKRHYKKLKAFKDELQLEKIKRGKESG